jgi:hypothetical protein
MFSGANLETNTPDTNGSLSNASVATTAKVSDARIGQSSTVTETSLPWSIWYDDIAFSDTVSPGPGIMTASAGLATGTGTSQGPNQGQAPGLATGTGKSLPSILLGNDFEGGSNGTTITAANSGGAGERVFDSVSSAGATVIYDNAHAAHGVLSGKFVCTSFNSGYVLWNLESPSKVWFRAYVYFTANPPGNTPLISVRSSGGATPAGIQINTSGKVRGVDATLTQQTITTNAINLNGWTRIEGFIIPSLTVGQIEVKLFLTSDSATPDETNTSGATLNTGSSATQIRFGLDGVGSGTWTTWLDDISVGNSAYLGPAVTQTNVTAGLASGTGTSQPLSQGRAAGLATGTGTSQPPGMVLPFVNLIDAFDDNISNTALWSADGAQIKEINSELELTNTHGSGLL